MAEGNADEAAVRELCAAIFAEPQRLFATVTHRVERPFSIEPHTHVDLLQFDLLAGCGGRAWSEGKWAPLKGITALVSYPGEPHGYELVPGDPPSRVYHLKLRVERSWQVIRRRVLPRVVTGMPHADGLINAIRMVVSPATAQRRPPLHTARLAETICLWPQTSKGMTPSPGNQSPQMEPWLSEAVAVIRARVSDPPSLDELAEVAGVSSRHFARQFQARLGTTPHAYINARRLTAASEMLLANQLKVRQIASAVGFSSVATFSRWFKDQTGMSPRRYRDDPSLL